jgi:hypothetical protein
MASQRHSVVWEYGRRRKITPVSKRSFRWHDFTPLAWRMSVCPETFRWLEVTPVPLERHRVTQVARADSENVRSLIWLGGACAYFDSLGQFQPNRVTPVA